MSRERIFVGRRGELSRFDEVLANAQGHAVVVTGQAGMGKTMLANRMAERARHHPDFKCGSVRYEVTATDSPASTMALMIDHAFEAAKVGKQFLSGTDRQWRGLFKAAGAMLEIGGAAMGGVPGVGRAAEAVGDLALSLMRDPGRKATAPPRGRLPARCGLCGALPMQHADSARHQRKYLRPC